MKKKLLPILALLVLIVGNFTNLNAQDSTTKNTMVSPPLFSGNNGFRVWSIGLQGGAMMPFTAFGGKTAFSKGLPRLSYGGYIKYQASHVFGIQLDVLGGTLEGNNEKIWGGLPPVSPYTSFKTDVHWAASLSGVATLGNINWNYMKTSIQPYVSLGVGYVNFNSILVDNMGASINFKPDGSETDLYIPLGLGFKANLSNSVNLDLGYTSAFVDASNLEGYVKPPYFGSKFSYAHIGLEFSLGSATKPQLAVHNPQAQLTQKMMDDNREMTAMINAMEENNKQRLIELNKLKEDHLKLKSDMDNDGVADYFDKCPGTQNGVRVDGAGCPWLNNKVDTVTKIYNNTTYIISEEDKKVANDAVRNLEFEFGKSTIRERSLPYLDKVAEILIKKGISLKLGGHTDAVGSENANMNLSKDRAEAIKSYLVTQGANGSRIEAVGYGETQPISTNKTDAGRQKNRRVEFTLY
jgi:OOP family OmpA-OmpF porin